jgi:tripartite-type tricarboxylate transporter receptor subunit TctC
MPKEIITQLNAKVIEIAKGDEMLARMRSIHTQVPIETPDEMRAYQLTDTKRNAELIKAANIKLE